MLVFFVCLLHPKGQLFSHKTSTKPPDKNPKQDSVQKAPVKNEQKADNNNRYSINGKTKDNNEAGKDKDKSTSSNKNQTKMSGSKTNTKPGSNKTSGSDNKNQGNSSSGDKKAQSKKIVGKPEGSAVEKAGKLVENGVKISDSLEKIEESEEPEEGNVKVTQGE